MAIYKSNLSSNSVTNGPSANASSYNPTYGYPYVAYTALSSEKSLQYGIFSTTNDYIKRGDNAFGETGHENTFVKMNSLYESLGSSPINVSKQQAENLAYKDYLALCPLGQNIKDDSKYYTLCVETTDDIDIPELIKIAVPYSNNARSAETYIDFGVYGFSKILTPFTGLSLFFHPNRYIQSGITPDPNAFYAMSNDWTSSYTGSGGSSAFGGDISDVTLRYLETNLKFISTTETAIKNTLMTAISEIGSWAPESIHNPWPTRDEVTSSISKALADFRLIIESCWFVDSDGNSMPMSFTSIDTEAVSISYTYYSGDMPYDGTYHYDRATFTFSANRRNPVNDAYLIGNSWSSIHYIPAFKLSGVYVAAAASSDVPSECSSTAYGYGSPFGAAWRNTHKGITEYGTFNRFDWFTISDNIPRSYNDSPPSTAGSDAIASSSYNVKIWHVLSFSQLASNMGTGSESNTSIGFLRDLNVKPTGGVFVSKLVLYFDKSPFIENGSFKAKLQINDVVYTKQDVDDDQDELLILDNVTVRGKDVVRFTINYSMNNSPAKIYTIIEGLGGNATWDATIEENMTAKFCSTQQAIRIFQNVQGINGSYSPFGAPSTSANKNAFTFLKLAGRIKLSLSGVNTYDVEEFKLLGSEVYLSDNSVVQAAVTNDILERNSSTKCLEEASRTLTTYVHRPFTFALSGDVYYNDSETSHKSVMTSNSESMRAGTNSIPYDNNIEMPTIQCGSFCYSGANTSYNGKSLANSQKELGATLRQISSAAGIPNFSSTYENPSNTMFYKFTAGGNNGNLYDYFTPNNAETLSNSTFLPATPGLKCKLMYDSVQFNGASAWTMMRTMPLTAGDKSNPHILLYSVEAWIEEVAGTESNGNGTVDVENTLKLKFSPADTRVYSGYLASPNMHTGSGSDGLGRVGMNTMFNEETGFADTTTPNKHTVINNIYLKYEDGNTKVIQGVGTGLPIYNMHSNSYFYGGDALSYKITDDTEFTYTQYDEYDPYSNLRQQRDLIYETLSTKVKQSISTGSVQFAIATCSGRTIADNISLENESTEYKYLNSLHHKEIYICVGFYNNTNRIMPLNTKFAFKYVAGGKDYIVYMSLSDFFPKDSMFYMSGIKEASANNDKIKFVSTEMVNAISRVKDDGYFGEYANAGMSTVVESELVNFAGDLDGNREHEISYNSISNGGLYGGKEYGSYGSDTHGSYGVLNLNTGIVSFVAPTKSSRSQYVDSLLVNYNNNIAGKALKQADYICYFPKTSNLPNLI